MLGISKFYCGSSVNEKTYEVADDNTTIVGAERFCCLEVLFLAKIHRQRGQRNLRQVFPDRLVRQRRVVRRHEASTCVVFSRFFRSCINMHHCGLFRITWLRPEHGLKLFKCFCVSAKNSEGQPEFRALHGAACDDQQSLHQKESIWYGLERSILYSLRTFQRMCISKASERGRLFPQYLPAGVVLKGRVR